MHGQEKSIQPEIGSGSHRGNENPGIQGESDRKRDRYRTLSGVSQEKSKEAITRMETDAEIVESNTELSQRSARLKHARPSVPDRYMRESNNV